MIRYVLAAAILAVPLAALAQTHTPAMEHERHGAAIEKPVASMPAQSGQGAFAAIQEIVAILDADPDTDWSKVDIDGLRRHLVDMSNVTLYAEVTATPAESGVRFAVTGTGPVRESIRRMVKAHAETMSGTGGMTFIAEVHPEGAAMTVTVENPADLPKLKGLGFFGILTLGMHHQAHHLMIAVGQGPHH
ncbi:MAG: hypothetical protein AB7G34_11525 [Hyphomicrobiales bacterium]